MTAQRPPAPPQVSLPRLYALRAMYLLILVGLGLTVWPQLLNHRPWEVMHSAAVCLLAAIGLMAAVGLRYPLQMLPLLMFELVWKVIWLVAIALPLWLSHQVDADVAETVKACLMGVILVPLVMPWRYVFATYVRRRGDRWTKAAA
jgi:hypothetical protein